MEINSFVIRVYGLCIDSRQRILLSDEFVFGREMTKFPGGGLEFGEGLIDCIRREMMEETGLEFKVLEHFYTTDFFIASAFHDNKQLISVYYFVDSDHLDQINTSEIVNDFESGVEGGQSLRWREIKEMDASELSFPIDRWVLGLLKIKLESNFKSDSPAF